MFGKILVDFGNVCIFRSEDNIFWACSKKDFRTLDFIQGFHTVEEAFNYLVENE